MGLIVVIPVSTTNCQIIRIQQLLQENCPGLPLAKDLERLYWLPSSEEVSVARFCSLPPLLSSYTTTTIGVAGTKATDWHSAFHPRMLDRQESLPFLFGLTNPPKTKVRATSGTSHPSQRRGTRSSPTHPVDFRRSMSQIILPR